MHMVHFEGLEGYAIGRMTKSRRGKLYIDDAGGGGPGGAARQPPGLQE